MKGYQMTTSFKFTAEEGTKGFPATRSGLHNLAFYAHAQYLYEGFEVTVCPPAIAAGVETPRSVRQAIRRSMK